MDKTPPERHFIGHDDGGGTYRSLCGVMVYIGLSPATVDIRNALSEGRVACPECRDLLEKMGVTR